MTQRSIFSPELAAAPLFMVGFLFLLGSILFIAYSLLSGHDSPFAHGTPPALSTASLQKEPPCVKRLLIKRLNDEHLVKTEDVSHDEKVCEQAATLGAAK